MTSPSGDPANYHVLLVGIDAYPRTPLYGCVNDIDAVQALLLERAEVREAQIRRLASPHPGATHATDVPGKPATLANLRTALAEIAREAEAGDRVFIYYSGHGTRLPVERADGRTFHREALVPVDVHDHPAPALLFDHELNGLLAAITARTRSVTLVLDCCHSAGATRDLAPELTPRVLDAREHLGVTRPIRDPAPGAPRGDGIARTVDDCHVVSACLNHEWAREGIGSDGKRHGLLTRAFLHALQEVPDAELTSVPWSRIWQAMRGDVESRNPQQHLWMAGNAGRAVLAGRPVHGDPGFAVQRTGDAYELGAGTLASVTESALIAVYGERPAEFPPVDSGEDREVRLGLVRVTGARISSAIAAAEGARFEVPPGARGRIIEPGKPARLRCALVPATAQVAAANDQVAAATAQVAAALAASPLLQVVAEDDAQVWLEQVGDRWLLTDDVHGTEPGAELFALRTDQLGRARDVLEHYFHYALPLRMAESAIDLAGALQLAVLACAGPVPAAGADTIDLPEAPATAGSSAYDVTAGALVCFQVHNRSAERLRVTLVSSSSRGMVRIFDEQGIDAGGTHRFWANNTMGEPYEMGVPDGKRRGIDRLIAIGTTANKDVQHLRLDRGFAELFGTAESSREIGARKKPSVEQWTATQVIVKTSAKEGPPRSK